MQRPVSDLMTRDLIVLEEWQNVLDVAKNMDRYELRHLPVVDGKRLVGLVSHRDLLRFTTSALEPTFAREARDRVLKERTFVGEIMTRDVETVKPDTPIEDAARKLAQARFGCLPVVDDRGELVGLVSERDLLRMLVGLLDLEAHRVAKAVPKRPPDLADRERDSVIPPPAEKR